MSDSVPVKVKKWRAVGYWTWDSIDQVDTCAICKNLLMEICIECMADQGEECTIAWGICNHKYHFHCISRWLAAHSTCPLDGKDWDFQKYESL